jgi:hypothetical protein
MRDVSRKLNPATASVFFSYEAFGDYPGGEYCLGRTYYWYDPEGRLPAVRDQEFRPKHPEISHADWVQLFLEAFDRGETAFVTKAQLSDPTPADSDSGSACGVRPVIPTAAAQDE